MSSHQFQHNNPTTTLTQEYSRLIAYHTTTNTTDSLFSAEFDNFYSYGQLGIMNRYTHMHTAESETVILINVFIYIYHITA